MPVATAAAAPPLDPPQVRWRFQGLIVSPYSSLSVNQRQENSGALVRPITIAPARRRLAIDGLSSTATRLAKAATPFVVAQPFWSVLILVVTGTPCNAPTGLPRASSRSARSASSSASSESVSTTAFTAGLTDARRARQAATASLLETRRVRIACASLTVSQRQSSSDMWPSRELCGLGRKPRSSIILESVQSADRQ